MVVGIVVCEVGKKIFMIEKVGVEFVGGNIKYIVGVMCFVYDMSDDLLFLLVYFDDFCVVCFDFGSYVV